jgi:protein-S-isoprenylcysteine O-methyltransferase Ste14
MNHSHQAYGLWLLVILNSAVFIIFAFSFFKPRTKRDWRSFSAFSAFVVALFVEMYGFPLTIFLLSGRLETRSPGVDLVSPNTGHLWETIFGLKGHPHFGALHIARSVLLVAGFWTLAATWPVLYRAQRSSQLATGGPYRHVRHPQYVGFVLIMLGFLFLCPTILTLAMFPVLVMYIKLALTEEHEAEREFGPIWQEYAARTPRFLHRSAANTIDRPLPAAHEQAGREAPRRRERRLSTVDLSIPTAMLAGVILAACCDLMNELPRHERA